METNKFLEMAKEKASKSGGTDSWQSINSLATIALAEEMHKFNENLEKLTTMDGSAIRMQIKNRE